MDDSEAAPDAAEPGAAAGLRPGGARRREEHALRHLRHTQLPSNPRRFDTDSLLEAGVAVLQTLVLAKIVFHGMMYLEEHNHCFMHCFGVKTLSGTLLGPAFDASGSGIFAHMEIGEFGVGRPDFGGRWPRGEALGQKKG